MRSTSRSFMAGMLLTVLAGVSFAFAQEASPAPPPQAPPAAQPAGELPQIPVARTEPAAAAPAPASDPFALKAAPARSLAAVKPAAASKTAATTAKHAATKPRSHPVEKPVVDVTDSAPATAPAASVAAVEPPANAPPANAAPVADSKPAPALKPAGDPVNPEAKSDRTMGFGGWLLFGIGVVALFGGITLVRRRRATVRHRSITDFSPTTAEVKLQPELARHP